MIVRPCCTKNLTQLLLDLATIFNENELYYWLDYGALLGIIRSGELIPTDKDIDFCIFAKDIEKYNSLGPLITAKGYAFYKILPENLASNNNFVPRVHLGDDKGHCADICAADIFINQVVPSRIPKAILLNHGDTYCYCDASYYEKLDEIEWKDTKIKIPSNVRKYLEVRYGPTWEIPDPDFFEHSRTGSA